MTCVLGVETKKVIVPDFIPLELLEPEEGVIYGSNKRLFVAGVFNGEYLSLRDEFLKTHSGREDRHRKKDLLLKVEYQGKTLEEINHGLAYFVKDIEQMKAYSSKSQYFSGGILIDGLSDEGLLHLIERIIKERRLSPNVFIHDSVGGHHYQFHEVTGKPKIHPYISRRDLVTG